MKRIVVALALLLSLVPLTACDDNKQDMERLRQENARLNDENALLQGQVDSLKADVAAAQANANAPMDGDFPAMEETEPPLTEEPVAEAPAEGAAH